MPILAAEPMLYPADLLVSAEQRAQGQWWVMHTLARQEKELMRRLRGLSIHHYCPLIKRRTKSPNGRLRVSHVPLFSSYVFVLADEQQRYQAMATNCIARSLEVCDADRFLTDLMQIQRLVETEAPLTPEKRIRRGQRVRVRSGAMLGLEGTVVNRRGKNWLVVSLEFLQQGASVLLEDAQVEIA